jgi:hypothetical protein
MITDLYTSLNTSIVELRKCEEIKNARLQECNRYYQCVRQNSPYIEKYHGLSAEIVKNFDRQQFNLAELTTNFAQIGCLDGKLATLQINMNDIQNFISPQAESIALLPDKYYDNLSFSQTNEAIAQIDSILYALGKAKEDAKERRRRRIENWKTAGNVAWTIIKYTAMVVGFVFVVIGGIIKIFASSSKDDD